MSNVISITAVRSARSLTNFLKAIRGTGTNEERIQELDARIDKIRKQLQDIQQGIKVVEGSDNE